MDSEPVYEVNRCRFIEYMPCSIQAIAITKHSKIQFDSEDIVKSYQTEQLPVYAAVSRGSSGNIELWNMGHDGQDIFLDRVLKNIKNFFEFYDVL